MTEKNVNDDSNEPTEDESMAGAFDFDVPEGDPDDVSDKSDDDSAQTTGDDDSAGEEDDTEDPGKPAEDVIDPKLLVRAGRMGLSDDEADGVLGLGSNKAITNMLDILESRKGQSGDKDASEEAEWFELSDEAAEELAPELAELLKSMNGSTRKAVEQMFSKYETRIQDMDQMLVGRENDAFDDAVDSLGKDWQPVFGKEGDTDDGHERNISRLRKAVFSGEYKGSFAKRVKTAVNDMFVEHSDKLAKGVKVEKARKRQGKLIGKPAQRTMTDADKSPRQRAVANASKFMKDKGMHPEQLESVDYSEQL